MNEFSISLQVFFFAAELKSNMVFHLLLIYLFMISKCAPILEQLVRASCQVVSRLVLLTNQ